MLCLSRIFLETSREVKGNGVSKSTKEWYVDAIPNIEIGNDELERVHNGEWGGAAMDASDSESARETRTSTRKLRDLQKRQHLWAKSLATSQTSARLFASCADLCADHVRRCMRNCLGFIVPLRGFCRAHCTARQRECPRECAGRF